MKIKTVWGPLSLLLALALTFATPTAFASGDRGDHRKRGCSVRELAGRWIFATGVGQLADLGADITALGTMNLDRQGNLHGKFDNNIAGFESAQNIKYFGAVELDPDCTGTLTFETDDGFFRADSIAVVSKNEILGMSRDPGNLWTYQVRRISRR